MTILIDIGHPAHVHYYRNLAKELDKKGHKIIWTVKDMDAAKHLMDCYGIKYTVLPSKKDGLMYKIFKQFQYDLILTNLCRKEKIDLAIGTSVTIAHISKISKIKSIVFDDDDDDVQPLVTKFVNPFASTLLSPDVLTGKRKRKDTLYYPGYHELAYLHPKRFSPDPEVLNESGIKLGETFFIMRFNVLKAHHDVGEQGLSIDQKMTLIDILKSSGKLFISTERDIDPEFDKYRLKISPDKIHSLLYYATIFIGDSQTMTSEAAVLGTPSLRCNSFANRISVLNEEEHKYGLTFGFLPNQFDLMINKLNELLLINNLKEKWTEKRQKMLDDKIDVTAYWLWLIENYPNTTFQYNQKSEFWIRFK